MKKCLANLFILFLSNAAFADASFLTQEQWLRRVDRELKNSLCDPTGYLKNCTNMKREICNQNIETANGRCLAKMKLPRKIDPLDDGLKYGSQLGQCIGISLEKNVKKISNPNPVCEIAL